MTGPEVQAALDQVAVNHQDILREAETRELADETLQSNIEAEAAIRHDDDVTLQQHIDAEAGTRLHEDENLQGQINEIVSGDATVSLSVSKSAVFVGEESQVSLTATTNVAASLISISGGNLAQPITGSGNTLAGSDTLNPEVKGSVQYAAQFTISGVTKSASPKTVAAVYPIFVGVGADLASVVFTNLTPRTSPSGATFQKTTANGDYIFIEVPHGMSVSKLYLVGAFDTELGIETIPTERVDAEGNAYTCYKNIEPRGEGTYNYKLQ